MKPSIGHENVDSGELLDTSDGDDVTEGTSDGPGEHLLGVVQRHLDCLWLAGIGAEVRWNAACVIRMIMVDDAVALLRTEPSDSTSDAVVVTSPGVLAACQSLFDAMWQDARALEDGFVAEPTHDEIDQELLKLLAAGATDAQVARALDMSPRQVGRRIARLATELDSVGRFAPGAPLSAAAGWPELASQRPPAQRPHGRVRPSAG